MKPFVLILIMAGGGLWIATSLYGLIRKDRKEDRTRSKVRFTETGDCGGEGGDGH